VHRSGATLTQDVSAVKLAAGDLLVLEAGPGFAAAAPSNRAFSLISEVPNSAPLKKRRMFVALALVVAMVSTQIIGGAINNDFINLWTAAMLTTALMLVTKCMSCDQARSAVDWEVYVCIAFAFGVSTAMEKTKVAKAIAEVFVSMSESLSLVLLLCEWFCWASVVFDLCVRPPTCCLPPMPH
jgi:di/tricarboxylate transporter